MQASQQYTHASIMDLGKVVNDVFQRYKQSVPDLRDLFGDRIVVSGL
jgi:hypothetical protein